METKDVGKLFVLFSTMANQARKALVFKQPTFELDYPYRYSNSVVVRFPFRKGLMVGWWKQSPATSLQEHFYMALGYKPEPDGTLEPIEWAAQAHTGAQGARVTRDPDYWDDLTAEELQALASESEKLYRTQRMSLQSVTDPWVDDEPI